MAISELAGKLAPKDILINVADLISNYYTIKPNMQKESNHVSFGTSGHRGSANDGSFNEDHILAITQAVAEYRKDKVKNMLFIGMDTHALSTPAHKTALEVLCANEITVYYAKDFGYTPTPVISHAILTHPGSDGMITNQIQNRANEILKDGLKDVKRVPLKEALASKFLIAYDFVTPYVKDLQKVRMLWVEAVWHIMTL